MLGRRSIQRMKRHRRKDMVEEPGDGEEKLQTVLLIYLLNLVEND
jgi:hypothetical protein